MFSVMRATTNGKGSPLGGYNPPASGRTEVSARHVVTGHALKERTELGKLNLMTSPPSPFFFF